MTQAWIGSQSDHWRSRSVSTRRLSPLATGSTWRRLMRTRPIWMAWTFTLPHAAVSPPSMTSPVPVTKAAASEAR